MPELVDAILLCGGAGLRLRSVTGNDPKTMAAVAGRPFMELLLKQLQRNGFERVILAVGYQRDVIQSYFGNQACGLRVAYSVETSPLGTGGALRNAAGMVKSNAVLIMNADSYTDADLEKFMREHRESKADVSMVVAPVDGRDDCGSVLVDRSSRVTGFAEKESSFRGEYLNAGIYAVPREMLYKITSERPVSLEKELFPRWIEEGKYIRAFVSLNKCVDIGTPERYQGAQESLANVEAETIVPVGEN
jgi:mannose-1-phosphate guanylyltransferase